MTTDVNRRGPPLSFYGASLWFVRNFVEALIWALAGAVVLVLALAAQRYPQGAFWTLLIACTLGSLAWGLIGWQFDLHVRIFRLDIRVVGEPRIEPRRDRL